MSPGDTAAAAAPEPRRFTFFGGSPCRLLLLLLLLPKVELNGGELPERVSGRIKVLIAWQLDQLLFRMASAVYSVTADGYVVPLDTADDSDTHPQQYQVYPWSCHNGVPQCFDARISKASHILPAPCSINNDYGAPDHSISKASHIFPAPCSINNDYSTPGSISKPLFKWDMTSYSGPAGINFEYFIAQSNPLLGAYLRYFAFFLLFFRYILLHFLFTDLSCVFDLRNTQLIQNTPDLMVFHIIQSPRLLIYCRHHVR